METCEVLCYGEIGVDNIIQADGLPSPENAIFPTSDSYHGGGAASNTAVWLSQMGVKVRLTGNTLGYDLYGDMILERLRRHPNIDLSFVEQRQGVTTPFTRAIVTPDGERSFLIFGYPQAPKIRLTKEMLQGVQYLALDLYGGPERLDTARLAFESGVTTAIGDVIWPDHPALPFTSIATNSGPYIRQHFPGVDVRQHARTLQSISKGIIIITGGPQTVYALDRHGNGFTVQPPVVTAMDATGAGDAFRAGLLYGLLRGFDLQRSVCWGVAAGSLKVKNLGAATTLPDFKEVESLANDL
ncbi:MAG TPA: carbohydrate kinase family protein, partial [Anaerolineales bacterium]|nr:carbohydrate kinase family protein [Anaerolineales bacterium]